MDGTQAVNHPAAGATEEQQHMLSRLDTFGLEIAQLRREAIDGRRLLGIEDEWMEDEEAYVGVDGANRHEYRASWRHLKPTGGTFTTESNPTKRASTNSTALINITRPYVDAAAARIADMLLPNDDRAWAIEPTPIPDLIESAREDVMIPLDPDNGLYVTEKEMAEAIMEAAEERAERGQKRIEDWLEEGRWAMQVRDVIENAGRLGTGVLKGPYPVKRRRLRWTFESQGARKSVEQEIKPESASVDPWNVFPDPTCGANHQDGNYFFERDSITKRRLLDLRGTPGYIDAQIQACLNEGPIQAEVDWTPSMEIERTQSVGGRTLYEIWYFYGMVERTDLEVAGLDLSDLPPEDDYFSALITMVNHRVIRAALSPLDDGTFPYDMYVWQRRPGMPWGIGVSRQIRTAQRMLTAAVRNMMDNAAASAGFQLIIDSTKVKPANDIWEIVARKIWLAVDGAEKLDVREAFGVVTIETRQGELMNIIEFALRMAEQATSLPMILQGQLGEQKIDTLGQQQMLQNNASSVLRRLAKQFDDAITVPHIGRYYLWLMEYGDESEKGDYNVVPRGSSTLVERDIQNNGIALIMDLSVKAPAMQLDPAKSAEEFIRSQRLDPKRFKMDEKQLAAQLPPPDPRVQAAEIKAQADSDKQALELADREQERQARMTETLIKTNTEVELFNAEQALAIEKGEGI